MRTLTTICILCLLITCSENKISRVGSNKEIKVDVRVLAATNKNLKKEIAENRFREDLYHRLSVILIKVPSLNERKEDIPILADYFLEMSASEYNMAKRTITKKAIDELQKINWTGNIREFRNVIERLVILGGDKITEKDVQSYAQPLSK